MNNKEQALIRTCKERLTGHYGSRFKNLILYGSMARGTEDQESDMDLLVLLDDPFDFFNELEALVNLLNDLQCQSDHYLSIRPARYLDFQNGRIQLYRNARREGIPV